jgi:hypothetical protein
LDYPGVAQDVGICVADEVFAVDCYMILLDNWDMVLGITFLWTLGPILWDFDDLCMDFMRGGHCMFWRGIGSQQFDIQSTRLYVVHAEQPLLDTLLTSYDDMFAEPQGLPPMLPCDHRIHLLPNTALVAVRPYRYAQL